MAAAVVAVVTVVLTPSPFRMLIHPGVLHLELVRRMSRGHRHGHGLRRYRRGTRVLSLRARVPGARARDGRALEVCGRGRGEVPGALGLVGVVGLPAGVVVGNAEAVVHFCLHVYAVPEVFCALEHLVFSFDLGVCRSVICPVAFGGEGGVNFCGWIDMCHWKGANSFLFLQLDLLSFGLEPVHVVGHWGAVSRELGPGMAAVRRDGWVSIFT